MSKQPNCDSFIWIVNGFIPALLNLPYTFSTPLDTPSELADTPTKWKWFRFRRWFSYNDGGTDLSSVFLSLTIPSRNAFVSYPDSQNHSYVSGFVQSNSLGICGSSPWIKLDTEYLPNNMVLTVNSLLNVPTTSDASYVLEMEFLDENYMTPPSI